MRITSIAQKTMKIKRGSDPYSPNHDRDPYSPNHDRDHAHDEAHEHDLRISWKPKEIVTLTIWIMIVTNSHGPRCSP